MKRNILLFKIIFPLAPLWFWLGIWILYYLRFTTFEGIAIIESVFLITQFSLEIPTGAIADIFGKKNTLIMALVLAGIGNVIMGFAPSILFLCAAVFFISLGGTLLSGNANALIYDTLKQLEREKEYDIIYASISKYELITNGLASIIGGFLYTLSVQLPFFATAVCYFVAVGFTLFIEEPRVDTFKFSFTNYVKQIRLGFSELFAHVSLRIFLFQSLILASFIAMLVEVFDATLAIHFGFDERGMGILFALVPFASALGYHLYPKIKKNISTKRIFPILFICFYATAGLSPWLGLFLGGVTILLRNLLDPVADVFISEKINSAVDSKYRATTLSTYSMLKFLPYLVFALFIGKYMDRYSPTAVLFVITLIYGVISLISLAVERARMTSGKHHKIKALSS